MKLWLEKLHLDLKVNWKLSRNQTTFKENFIVHLHSEFGSFRSEVAPNIRYGETPEKLERQFSEWLSKTDLQSLKDQETLTKNLDEASLFHSLRFGVEAVLLSHFARTQNKSLAEYLALPDWKPGHTSFSMPIIPVSEVKAYLEPLKRFDSLKIKVNAETALDMLLEINKHTRQKLRVDANEGWRDFDEFMRFHNALQGMNIELIEQPFPSDLTSEYKELKKRTSYVLLADESIEDVGDFGELSQGFHAVNIKLMKTGSLLRARDLILKAHAHGMTAMMGCMIETTIGISYGMLFTGMVEYVDLDGFLLIKNEPFRLVSETEGRLSLS
jgi:L-alanine-DL-glutamate epimerase-like enolase superfamily enzyme